MSSVRKSDRKHIVFTGRRNAGKSSLINAFLGQELSIVSDVPGTTTDPVKKAMELLPYGPVVLVDTAGIDDVGELGKKRIDKTVKMISDADIVIYVLDASDEVTADDREYIDYLNRIETPFIIVLNKSDLGVNPKIKEQISGFQVPVYEVSCSKESGIYELKEAVVKFIPHDEEIPLIGDLVRQGDIVVMVVPIDLGAPKGRLIMPQVQSIRETLDSSAIALVVKDMELRAALNRLSEPPALVITDSQAIMRVAADVPDSVKLTTFSILMARYKGDLHMFIKGIRRVDDLENGDKVLISEACSHHVQEDDIGRVKIPRWLKNYTRKDIAFDIVSGHDFPENLADYKLVIHCGACTLTRKAMMRRMKQAEYVEVPMVNYGLIISYMHGAIPRALEPFNDAVALWDSLF